VIHSEIFVIVIKIFDLDRDESIKVMSGVAGPTLKKMQGKTIYSLFPESLKQRYTVGVRSSPLLTNSSGENTMDAVSTIVMKRLVQSFQVGKPELISVLRYAVVISLLLKAKGFSSKSSRLFLLFMVLGLLVRKRNSSRAVNDTARSHWEISMCSI
jgi:hypothetical protein